MKIHELQQGSEEWRAHRAQHFNASDAPAMMGVSPYKSRSQLLHEMATGLGQEVDDATQRRFDDGHRFEALARPLAEEIIGAELYPVVGSEGKLAASFDGLTMLEDICFEHKTMNDDIRACQSAGHLPLHYRIQMEQQLMVSGAEKCLFMASRWDGETLSEKICIWYEPDLELRERIVAGWEQFEKDLANYVPPEIVDPPKAEPIKDLPAVVINASGGLSVCNLAEVTPIFDLFINNAKTELVTDDDFANGEETAKKSRSVAKTLKMKAKEVIDQIATVGDAVRTLELYAAKFDQLGLTLEKAVKEQKEAIKSKIMAEARQAYTLCIAALESEIEPIRLVCAQPDFANAMKGKRTLASLHGAVGDELAKAKINADSAAKDMRAKLSWIAKHADAYRFLLNDLQQIIQKPFDDFTLLVTTRIDAHKKAEAEKVEAERKSIQAAEEAKAQAKVAAELAKQNHEYLTKLAHRANVNGGFATPEDQRAKAEPVGETFPAIVSSPPINAQAVVIEAQDEISAFLNSLDCDEKKRQAIRPYLVEFVKFQASRRALSIGKRIAA